MYALDGYGIPWFYHMYPVPWLFPPMYTKGRCRSPKKLRPKKQRSTLIGDQQGQHNVDPLIEMGSMASATDVAPSQPEGIFENTAAPNLQESAAASGNVAVPSATASAKASDGPFATQFDIVARQTALQTGTNTMLPPQLDLTTIRNVPVQDFLQQGNAQGYNTVPSRRRNHRHAGNGLYGGRGNVGVPLYATAPFPEPVPPMGRPIEGYVGYTVGTKACGTIEVEKAAERGGGQACNICEPDH